MSCARFAGECLVGISVNSLNALNAQQHSKILHQILNEGFKNETRQSKHCGFSIYIFDNSKSMVRLVRAERMVLSGLVFARKIARMILIQNIQGLLGPLMINMAFMPLYM